MILALEERSFASTAGYRIINRCSLVLRELLRIIFFLFFSIFAIALSTYPLNLQNVFLFIIAMPSSI